MVGEHVIVCVLTLAAASLALASNAWTEPATKDATALKADLKAQPFDLNRVRLLEGPFRETMERDRKYLYDLDSDRLLHTWRLNAGVPSKAEPYGGWERPECEVRGHTLGHYLSGCALMYASTGDETLKAKADAIVAELAKCQEALGDSGYLSAFPESFIERAEKCEGVWAPFYVLHKLYAGLQDMYVHCGNRQALDVVEKMAGWLKGRLDKLDETQMQAMLNTTEQGGVNETLANLYALTGNTDYLAMARRFDQARYVKPLAQGEDRMKGEHVNSFVPNIIGTARQYEMGGDERDRRIAEYFWNQVTGARSYCTGGTSNKEHWHSGPNELAHELSDHTQETCCTYNMLKLTRHLFSWEPDAKYADYYERALWNSILSTQSPETGMMMYFVVLASGRWKMFNLPYDAFWCCTGTGLENHAKYGDSIYFHNDDELFVNQFIASEVDWQERGVKIRQEARFPEEERTTLILSAAKPVTFTMRVRVPYWVGDGFAVTVNGEAIDAPAKPCSYVGIDRTWQDGDRVEMLLPMGLHAHPMPDDENLVAFMYGPFVLAGKLGGEGLTRENVHTDKNWYVFPNPASVPPLLGDPENPAEWIKPVAGEVLTFTTTGQGKNVALVPYHRLFGERYAVYWQVYVEGSPEHQAWLEQEAIDKERAARTTDQVFIGDKASEEAHELKGEKTGTGPAFGRYWRHATDGGWFSYTVEVAPDAPMVLVCTYWGSDVGNRVFDILVEGKAVATQKLDNNAPHELFDVEYAVPLALTEGKEKVTITFQAKPAAMAGGVFDLRMMKAKAGK